MTTRALKKLHMGEINNSGEDQKIDTEQGADNQDESQNDSGADGEDKGSDKSDDENADDGDEADNDDDSEDDKSKDDDQKSKPTPKADEPQTRKRNVDFILERKNRKIEKLQSKEKDGANDDEEDDDDIDDLDKSIIDKRIQKHLNPLIQKQMQEEDDREINDFVVKNPDFKPYIDTVRKYSQHDSRKSLPIESIFYEVAGKDLMRIGAQRAKKAGDETRKTQAGGGSGVSTEQPKSAWDLTPEEFAAEQDKIRTRSRD